MEYPTTPVIAERFFQFEGPNGRSEVIVSIGTPHPIPDEDSDWYCPYRIEGPDHIREQYAMGVDSLQALLMAISAVRADTRALASRGQLTYLGQRDTMISLIGADA